jgi:hypothetical protein
VENPDRFYRSSLPLTWRERLGKGVKDKFMGFGIGVAVGGVAHLLALAEDRVGLVEKENEGDALGSAKDALQVLFRLSDILVDHGAEVHRCRSPARRAGGNKAAKVLPVQSDVENSARSPSPLIIKTWGFVRIAI